MKLNRPKVPIGLPLAAVILLVLGIVASPAINALTTEEQRAKNVILSAIPFVFIFVAIILVYMTVIWLIVSALHHQISAQTYRVIELITIAGIALGIIGMFQPWIFAAYKYGFLLLLFSTLAFILWSHITPAGRHQEEETGSMSLTEFEQKQSHT